jgi:hypothetical protein
MTLKVPADNERKGKKKIQLRVSEPLTKLFQNPSKKILLRIITENIEKQKKKTFWGFLKSAKVARSQGKTFRDRHILNNKLQQVAKILQQDSFKYIVNSLYNQVHLSHSCLCHTIYFR